MSVEAIPVEILMMIFKNLKGAEATACRAVCRRWRNAVDSLTDNAWRDFRHRDFWNPERAKRVSHLGYRDLYKSLTLWSKVEEAQEQCPTKPVKGVTSLFKVLNNNTVAVLRFFRNIEYYDIKSMKISRKTFKFDIGICDENEYLIAILNSENGSIHVIIKSNDRELIVGEPDPFFDPIDRMFTLLDTELYFRSGQDMLCVARLKVVDGEETIETVELSGLGEYVVAFARAGDDGVNVLTDEGNIYSYCFGTAEFTLRWRVKCEDDNVTIALRRFGFLWSDANIYTWLSDNFPEEQLQITELEPTVIHTHNHVVLLGTDCGSVHVYKRPYNENGELKIYKSKPDRSIDINKYYSEVNHSIGRIEQVNVVETLYRHRLLLLASLRNCCSHWLFCIHLSHKQHEIMKMGVRRPAEETPMQPTKKPRLS